MRRSG
ncbi:hypothetical protein YPPY04_4305, partial [Yersinia pestis PY-04]|jgi:transposase